MAPLRLYVLSKPTMPIRFTPCHLPDKQRVNYVHHANAIAQQAVLVDKACTTARQCKQVWMSACAHALACGSLLRASLGMNLGQSGEPPILQAAVPARAPDATQVEAFCLLHIWTVGRLPSMETELMWWILSSAFRPLW